MADDPAAVLNAATDRLMSFAAGLGLDRDAVYRIVAEIHAEAETDGRWRGEEARFAEARRRMIAAG